MQACLLVPIICLPSAGAQQASDTPRTRDLSQLSLEELTKIEVSSVTRKDQELFRTPAAVYVITKEDIRNSGARSLPELFRMVPGMQVAQVYANEWAVSARGFNSRFADKMLVLVDGRSIYSEIYSGVFWDQNDVLLGDIDRIEVIRGPGGTLWGANAVNGIINIITSKARETAGTRATVESGRIADDGSFRYGGQIGDHVQYRGYEKYLQRNSLLTDAGLSAHDEGHTNQGGGRLDWQPDQQDTVTTQGDIYRGNEEQHVYEFTPTGAVIATNAVTTSGGYSLARWEHRFISSDLALQGYFNQERHGELAGNGRERSYDLDFQHHLAALHRNDIIWGLGARLTTDHIFGAPIPFVHNAHRDRLLSLFFEDDYSLLPEKLVVTSGFKLQHNSYTGFEIQPDLRAIYTPDLRHAVWGAISRAVRTPSVQDRDLHFLEPEPSPGPLPLEVLAQGNPAFHSEVVIAYEGGYRQQLGRVLSLDLAGFINHYSSLRYTPVLAPYVTVTPEPTVIVPTIYTNSMLARTHGLEAALSWNPAPRLRIQASYGWLNNHSYLPGNQPAPEGDLWSTPTNTLDLRSTWSLSRHWALTSSTYSVSRLERPLANGAPSVRGFNRLDSQVTFKLSEAIQCSAGGANLLDARHPEFDPGDGYSIRSQVPRSAFFNAVWSF